MRQLRGSVRRWPGIQFFYCEDPPAACCGQKLTREQALEQARALARAERNKDQPMAPSSRGRAAL